MGENLTFSAIAYLIIYIVHLGITIGLLTLLKYIKVIYTNIDNGTEFLSLEKQRINIVY